MEWWNNGILEQWETQPRRENWVRLVRFVLSVATASFRRMNTDSQTENWELPSENHQLALSPTTGYRLPLLTFLSYVVLLLYEFLSSLSRQSPSERGFPDRKESRRVRITHRLFVPAATGPALAGRDEEAIDRRTEDGVCRIVGTGGEGGQFQAGGRVLCVAWPACGLGSVPSPRPEVSLHRQQPPQHKDKGTDADDRNDPDCGPTWIGDRHQFHRSHPLKGCHPV